MYQRKSYNIYRFIFNFYKREREYLKMLLPVRSLTSKLLAVTSEFKI